MTPRSPTSLKYGYEFHGVLKVHPKVLFDSRCCQGEQEYWKLDQCFSFNVYREECEELMLVMVESIVDAKSVNSVSSIVSEKTNSAQAYFQIYPEKAHQKSFESSLHSSPSSNRRRNFWLQIWTELRNRCQLKGYGENVGCRNVPKEPDRAQRCSNGHLLFHCTSSFKEKRLFEESKSRCIVAPPRFWYSQQRLIPSNVWDRNVDIIRWNIGEVCERLYC